LQLGCGDVRRVRVDGLVLIRGVRRGARRFQSEPETDRRRDDDSASDED